MNLFEDVEAENDKYISVFDALEFAAKKINYGVPDIARRLLLDKFNQIACMFKINDYGKIDLWCSEKDFNGDYASTTEFLKVAVSTLGTFEYTQEDTWGNEYQYTKDVWLDNYWIKSDFFEFDTIKKLKILENDLEEFLNARTQEAITDLFVRHDINKHSELTKKNSADISQKFLREQKEFESNEDLEKSTPYIPLFYLNDTFSLIEASCLISRDDPIQMNRCFHDTNFDQNHPYFNEAYNFINSAIWAGNLPENTIPSHQLKTYLLSKGKVINGFNDDLPTQDHTNIGQPSIQQTEPDTEKLNAEITRLRQLLTAKDVEINSLTNTINELDVKNIELQKYARILHEENLHLMEKEANSNDTIRGLNNSALWLESEKVELEIENKGLKTKITELENEKIPFQLSENATINQEISLENSDLILISVLLKMLQDEIKIKSHKPQAKILQKIEDSHGHIKGLSKSRTDKLMGKANRLYKQLNNIEMQ